MVCLIIPGWHIVQALFDDPQTLPHFLNTNHAPIIAIPIVANWDFEIKLFIARIRSLFAKIPALPTGPQPGPSHTPFDPEPRRFLCVNS